MKKEAILFSLIPVILVWAIDQLTKYYAVQNPEHIKIWYFHTMLHWNPGAMLGVFSDLPSILRVVALSTTGAFLICIYSIIQYLLPINSLWMRTGLGMLLGGILGNVTDRIVYGKVVDFLIIGNETFFSPAFNMADLLQWVGYGILVTMFIKHGNKIWPVVEVRKRSWVNPEFQLKYSLILTAVGFLLSVVTLVLSYTYIRVTIIDIVGHNNRILEKFLTPFLVLFGIFSAFFCAVLFLVAKTLSHQIAGPLYAFEKFISDTLAGQDREFKLRAKDEFKELEEIAKSLRTRIRDLEEKAKVNSEKN